MTKSIDEMLSYYSSHVEFIGELVENVTQVGIFGTQVLHLAAFQGRLDEIEAFLAAGAEINAIGDLGLTPMHYAVLGGQCAAIRMLLQNGASRSIENEFGETALQMARLMCDRDSAEILSDGKSFEGLSVDESVKAGKRWAEFKKIQELNFPEQ